MAYRCPPGRRAGDYRRTAADRCAGAARAHIVTRPDPAQPWMWLSPDGSVSYTGRQPAAGNPLSNNALTLMALGAGIAQGGIGKGLQQAATAAEADRQQQAQRYGVLQNYDALTDAGVPRDQARAAIYDPRVMSAVATKYFGGKQGAGASPSTQNIPPLPPGVPDGSRFSPSRDLFMDPDGVLF